MSDLQRYRVTTLRDERDDDGSYCYAAEAQSVIAELESNHATLDAEITSLHVEISKQTTGIAAHHKKHATLLANVGELVEAFKIRAERNDHGETWAMAHRDLIEGKNHPTLVEFIAKLKQEEETT